jgi:hypothetical protein
MAKPKIYYWDASVFITNSANSISIGNAETSRVSENSSRGSKGNPKVPACHQTIRTALAPLKSN